MRLFPIAIAAFLTLAAVPPALAQGGPKGPGPGMGQPRTGAMPPGMPPGAQDMRGWQGGRWMRGAPGRGGMMHMRVMMILMDTNGDGSLSLEEVQAAHARIFRAVDADNSGGVTFEEIQTFLRGPSPPG